MEVQNARSKNPGHLPPVRSLNGTCGGSPSPGTASALVRSVYRPVEPAPGGARGEYGRCDALDTSIPGRYFPYWFIYLLGKYNHKP